MAEFPSPHDPARTIPAPGGGAVSAAVAVYLIFAVAAVLQIVSSGLAAPVPLLSLVGIVGVIIAYVKRGDARGTFVASHFDWLIRTFWWQLLWGIFGWVILLTLGLLLIGIPIAFLLWTIVSIWVLYRVIRGYLRFKDNRPID